MIVIISNQFDFAIDYVVRELNRRGENTLRINSEDLINHPVVTTFPDFSYKITFQGKMMEINKQLKSVWFRRPGKPFEWLSHKEKPSPQVLRFVEDQWHSFLEGLLAIPDVLWVNNISRNQDAECKIIQLMAAQKVGFKLPKTCITSDAGKAKAFSDMLNGEVIVKALYAPLIEYDDKDYFIFTNKIKPELIDHDSLKLAPCIFQEFISPKTEYRITVIGDDIFPVTVNPGNDSTHVDWRKEKCEIKFKSCEVPSLIKKRCFDLVAELDLVFGAIDLVERDGHFYFLEINPNGEWAWLQEEAGLDIASSIATTLAKGLEIP